MLVFVRKGLQDNGEELSPFYVLSFYAIIAVENCHLEVTILLPEGDGLEAKMKETNLYEIRDKAIKSGRMVFSVAELSNLIGKEKKTAKVYLSRLAKQGLAFRIVRGKISFTDDEYLIATQFIEPSYISLLSALNFHGAVQQVPRFIQCVTPKNTRTFENYGIEYHKIAKNLFFGYKAHKKENSYIFVADKEKALLDGIYLKQFDLSFLEENLGQVDRRLILEYSLKFSIRIQKMIRELLSK